MDFPPVSPSRMETQGQLLVAKQRKTCYNAITVETTHGNAQDEYPSLAQQREAAIGCKPPHGARWRRPPARLALKPPLAGVWRYGWPPLPGLHECSSPPLLGMLASMPPVDDLWRRGTGIRRVEPREATHPLSSQDGRKGVLFWLLFFCFGCQYH
jgi:hypothetical protein